jgi:tetratricopeptide (TPR) repeat protein
MTSKYNPLFNGEEAFLAGVQKIETGWNDDFSSVLAVYKWPDEQAATAVVADMDRAIEKGVKVIQAHSMYIGNSQKNDYIDDSYILMGKARFYKREFFPAMETFNYILQQFDKELIVYDARLWLARCKIGMNNPSGALTDFELLYNNPKLPKELRVPVLASMAQMNIGLQDWPAVAANLDEAVRFSKKKEDKVRYTFIQAQALERSGETQRASDLYAKVVKMQPEYNFYFHSQLNRARNFDVYANDPRPVYKELEKMVADDKNIENRDQIYYVMAELSLKEEEFENAEDYLGLSIRNSKSNTIQKGLSYLKIGEIEFDFNNYVQAQAYYDSAYKSFPPDHPKYAQVKSRSETLTRMVADLTTIQEQDSLQRMALLPYADQANRIEKYIKRLKKEEEKQKELAELAALNKELAESSGSIQEPTAAPRSGKWYFYNPALVSGGRADFRKKWGERINADNWRQRSRMSNDIANTSEEENTETSSTGEKEEGAQGGGKYDLSTYLAKIPDTEDKLTASHQLIKDAFIDLGLVYKDGLEDIKKAIKSYENLLVRYDTFVEKPRVLYSLFLMYKSQSMNEEMLRCKNALLSDFKGTEFALLAERDGVPLLVEDRRPCLVDYEFAYKEYQANRFSKAAAAAKKGLSDCSSDELRPRYLMVYALSAGGMGNRDSLVARLKRVQSIYPATEQGAKAKQMLEMLGESGTAAAKSEGAEGESSPKAGSGVEYKVNLKATHRYVLLVKGAENGINPLQIAFSDHNSENHRFEKLQIQIMPLGKEYLALVVNGLKDSDAGKKYLQTLAADLAIQELLKAENHEYFIISQENFLPFYRGKDVDGYKIFYQKNYL